MKIIVKNFWKIKCNCFPLFHMSFVVEEYTRDYKTVSKCRTEFGLLGFCLIAEI